MDSENYTINNFIPKGQNTSTSSVSGNVLTITSGAGGHSLSLQLNKKYEYGNNVYVGTTFSGGTNTPQIHVRASEYGDDAYICFLSSGVPKVRVRQNGSFQDITGSEIDGIGTDDIEARVVTFSNLLDFTLLQRGCVVGGLRVLNSNVFGEHNGLGANVSTSYKSPFRFGCLKSLVNIVCVGDSNTGGMYLTPKQEYPSQLQSMKYYQGVSVINMGVRGNRVSDVVARLPSILNQYVEGARNIVTLMIGTNDATYSMTAQNIYNTTISNLVYPLQSAGFEVWIITPPPCGSSQNTNGIVLSLNNLIMAGNVCDKKIDLATKLVDNNGDCLPWCYHSDLKHLSEYGVGIISKLIFKILDTQ